jgi:hypothetical protein
MLTASQLVSLVINDSRDDFHAVWTVEFDQSSSW